MKIYGMMIEITSAFIRIFRRQLKFFFIVVLPFALPLLLNGCVSEQKTPPAEPPFPMVTAENLFAVNALDQQHIWIVGFNSTIIHTADGGKTWEDAHLDDGSQGKYAYRSFSYTCKPKESGKFTMLCKASNERGEEQPFAKDIKWNRGGYKYNGIDEVTVEVV